MAVIKFILLFFFALFMITIIRIVFSVLKVMSLHKTFKKHDTMFGQKKNTKKSQNQSGVIEIDKNDYKVE